MTQPVMSGHAWLASPTSRWLGRGQDAPGGHASSKGGEHEAVPLLHVYFDVNPRTRVVIHGYDRARRPNWRSTAIISSSPRSRIGVPGGSRCVEPDPIEEPRRGALARSRGRRLHQPNERAYGTDSPTAIRALLDVEFDPPARQPTQ